MDAGRSQAANVEFPRNRRKRQDIVVVIRRLLRRKLLVFLAHDIVASLIGQKIALEGRLLVVGRNARLETSVGGFNVAETVVNANDNRRVRICNVHAVSFIFTKLLQIWLFPLQTRKKLVYYCP